MNQAEPKRFPPKERRDAVAAFGWMDVQLLLLVVIWGANFAIVKSALSEITPMAFNALRFAGGSVLTLALAWIVERNLSIARKDWVPVLGVGLLSGFLYQILFIQGQARTQAGNASLILSTTPIFVALMGTVLRSERLPGRNWIGIGLSFTGIVLLIAGGASAIALSGRTLLGDLLVLGCTVTWSAYTVLSRPLMQRYSALNLTAWMMAASTPPLVLIAIPELRATQWQTISAQSWLGLLYSGVLAIAVGYVIWNLGVKQLGGTRTAAYKYLTPIVTVVVSRLFFGETMQPLQALGALGILLGMALARSQQP
jgi:drug/metabolite transporter (DMT)-like permease